MKVEKRIWLLCLIFLAVFLGAQILEGLLLTPIMIGEIFREIEKSGINTGNFFEVYKYTTQAYEMSDGAILAMLYLTVLATVTACFYCVKIEKRSLATMGYTREKCLKKYITGYGVGALIISAICMLCKANGTLVVDTGKKNIPLLLLYILAWGLQGLSEETLCRGWLLSSISVHHNNSIAVLVSALMFALLHIANAGVTLIAFLNLFLFGVFAGIYYLKSKSIWGIAAVHSAWNCFQGTVFGINVSGMNPGSTIFSSQSQDTLFSGGAFGLEGGIFVTIFLVIGIILLLNIGEMKKFFKKFVKMHKKKI